MKIYYIAVLEKIGDSGKTLVAAEELNTFSFFQRKTVREFLKFTSEVVVSRTSVEQRVRVKNIPNWNELDTLEELRKRQAACKFYLSYAGCPLPIFAILMKSNKLKINFKFKKSLGSKDPSLNFSSSSAEKEYFCHCFVRSDYLSAVLISDDEYPQRVAFTLLSKILDEYKLHSSSISSSSSPPQNTVWLDDLLFKYQNPREADPMMKVQKELDETKVILHSTIETVLSRGEKLDDLVAQSDALSATSKQFYTTAKKTNSCCNIL